MKKLATLLVVLIVVYCSYSVPSQTLQTEILESREIDLKGCIQTIFTKQFIIKTETEYLKTIRNDASRDYCLKNVEKIEDAFKSVSMKNFSLPVV